MYDLRDQKLKWYGNERKKVFHRYEQYKQHKLKDDHFSYTNIFDIQITDVFFQCL